jgi:hypothetical protein
MPLPERKRLGATLKNDISIGYSNFRLRAGAAEAENALPAPRQKELFTDRGRVQRLGVELLPNGDANLGAAAWRSRRALWFDSGRPDIFCGVLAHSEPGALPLRSYSCWDADNTQACFTTFKYEMDTLGIEPRASRMLSGCDTTTPCARAQDMSICMSCIAAIITFHRNRHRRRHHNR